MKSAGVFVGGLTSILTINLMLVSVCSSAPVTMPAAAARPPLPTPVVRMTTAPAQPQAEPIPWGTFIWGCGGHIAVDPEGAIALPICLNRGR